jgi:hypothetical protein
LLRELDILTDKTPLTVEFTVTVACPLELRAALSVTGLGVAVTEPDPPVPTT